MANDFMTDKTFLLKVNKHRVRENWAAINILDFETENVLTRLEGKVISGNMAIAANSPTRRTGSLSVLFEDTVRKNAYIDKGAEDYIPQDVCLYNLTDARNLIAINKKISLSIGITNPYYHTDEYQKYGEVLWFPQGIFIITQANSSISTSGATININFIDKMGYLNGTCGGILPASTTLHYSTVITEDGSTIKEYPLISDIIKEVVHHFGNEHPSRIIIEDIDPVGRQVVRYVGSEILSFATQTDGEKIKNGSFKITPAVDDAPGGITEHYQDHYYKNDIVGYLEIPATYPGELVFAAGSNVTQILDTIASTLGNFEYFYDVDGNFHFRRKSNFNQTGATPLNLSTTEDSDFNAYYMPHYSDTEFINEFADTDLAISVNFNPNYSNIKNDFVVWGTAEDTKLVRYHLAIDERPKDIKRGQQKSGNDYSLCHKYIWSILDNTTGVILRYESVLNATDIPTYNVGETLGLCVAPALESLFEGDATFNWREELYRRALLAYGTSTKGSYYDEELLAEWRLIYDPTSTQATQGSKSFEYLWNQYFSNDNIKWTGYTKDALVDPSKLRYWLDIIDSSTAIGEFSVNRIGRRTRVTENSKIKAVFDRTINDIVFIENTGDWAEMQAKFKYYREIGQGFALLTKDQMSLISTTSSNATCYDEIRTMLYENLIYNSSVSLSCIPIFYLDVNKILHLNFSNLGVVGNYIINNISWSLGNTTTMSLSLTEALVVV